MRILSVRELCLVAILSNVAPVMAEEIPAVPVPTAVLVTAPISSPQAIIAAQNAQTLTIVASMRTRLAELVPASPRDDAIALSAEAYASQWQTVISSYAHAQLQMVDSMIIGLNAQHEARIEDFMNAKPMVQIESLFADSKFTIPSQLPIDFTNPPLLNAGFFGS